MNNNRKPNWYKELKNGPMTKRQDEEEFIYKIKQSIHKNGESTPSRHRQPFRKKRFFIAAVLVFTVVLLNFQQFWFDENKPPVQSSTQIEVKIKDESYEDQSLRQFISELYESTNLKNENDLYKALDDEFIFEGAKYNKNEWELDESMFNYLQVALAMGGEFVNDAKTLYKIPSGLAESNQTKQERYIYATVTGEETKILAEPKLNSHVLYQVSNEIVKAWIPEKAKNEGYVKITTIDGYTGYVEKNKISTDVKYSFTFEKNSNGTWKIKNIDFLW
ncbi:ECF-type sigma factor negative effector [Bacillus manliponensis]|uniref:ECF-type sigma factor negative effector n=1 Tax=Bacillus manliponensis TaxID=574376 RepID=A0A073JWH9_9BACI|nr:SH3 domain-containing protein [Bacillus manliponensis]KEK18660.1 ECF-type sigma factor negative effector [Bacillus manliponensis]